MKVRMLQKIRGDLHRNLGDGSGYPNGVDVGDIVDIPEAA